MVVKFEVPTVARLTFLSTAAQSVGVYVMFMAPKDAHHDFIYVKCSGDDAIGQVLSLKQFTHAFASDMDAASRNAWLTVRVQIIDSDFDQDRLLDIYRELRVDARGYIL